MGFVMELITDHDSPPKIQVAALAALLEMTDPIEASLSSASNGQCKCCHHDVIFERRREAAPGLPTTRVGFMLFMSCATDSEPLPQRQGLAASGTHTSPKLSCA